MKLEKIILAGHNHAAASIDHIDRESKLRRRELGNDLSGVRGVLNDTRCDARGLLR
jgi:hypothetical protein